MGPTVRKVAEELRRMIEGIEVLEAETAGLVKTREDLRRYLDIDAEKKELEALQLEKAGILAEANAEAGRIVGQAKAGADDLRRKSAEKAERTAESILGRAHAEANDIRREAELAGNGLRAEARKLVADAQSQSANLLREAEEVQRSATNALRDATLSASLLATRETELAEKERQFATAQEEFNRQADALRVSLLNLR